MTYPSNKDKSDLALVYRCKKYKKKEVGTSGSM